MAGEDKVGGVAAAADQLRDRIRALGPLAKDDEEPDALGYKMTVKEKRIDVIVRMMVSGNWVTGLSHQMLSDAWNLRVPTVEHMACEANRAVRLLVRLQPEAQKEQLARIIQNAERIAQKAEAKGSKSGYRDALEANKFLAQLFGLVKTEVEVTDKRAEFAGWSDEELATYLATGERPKKRAS